MTKGRARLAIGEGISVWILEAPDGFGEAGVHAHHAIQITACLSGALALESAGRRVEAPAVAVAADAPHRFEAHGLLAFIFVEPESRMGRGLSVALFGEGPLARVDAPRFTDLLQGLGTALDQRTPDDVLLDRGRGALGALAPVEDPGLPDPRVQHIIAYAAAHLDGPLSLNRAAAGVHLSSSRLRHLFVEQTGLAFKTYVLWLRLVRAVQIYAGGGSLTEAAHLAGFSDSAHFSRVFRRTFGLPATTLTRL